MFLDNKKLSFRQVFRMGLLENITLGIVIIPFVTTNLAGKYHFLALLLGLLLTMAYIWIIYFLSREMPGGIGKELMKMGTLGKGCNLIYGLRYILRAGIIMLFFGKVVQEYMLQSFNLWLIIIPFALVCGYGAKRGMEKRGRMVELLFWWMLVPLILVAVFAISSISWQDLPEELKGVGYESIREYSGVMDVFRGAYVTFLVTSSTELLLFSLPRQREDNWRNTLKIGLWIVISIFLAYIFIIGILGGHWVSRDPQAALNVMEASYLPGRVVERVDYPVLAFWIIGVFTLISGYMLHARENLIDLVGLRKKSGKGFIIYVVIAAVILLAWVWSNEAVSEYLAMYMFGFDILISLLVPILVVMVKKKILTPVGGTSKSVRAKANLLLLITAVSFMLVGCNNKEFEPLQDKSDSVENRDYAMEVSIDNNNFAFTIADIAQYSGGEGKELKTKEYECEANSLEEALEYYYNEKERQLDVGHLKRITIKNLNDNQLIIEMSSMSKLGKSVTVTIEADGEKQEIILRELIKKAYAGEDFS